MSYFARSATSALIHTFVGAIIGGTITSLIFGGIYLAFADQAGQAFFAALFFGFLGSVFGAFVGFLIWGARGWISGFKSARSGWQDYRDDGVINGSVPAHRPFFDNNTYAPATPVDTEDPWQGQNPYGCCRNHTDAAGNPTHGGPGCQHPSLSRH